MPDSDRKPVPDQAEANAYFPSPYSLTQYVSPKTDFKLGDADYQKPYTGGRWKVLCIATQERYLTMKHGEFFSTGNHPVEMLLPILHLDAAGFDVDVATLTGEPVKLEMWACPKDDEAFKAIYEKFLPKLRCPLSLEALWERGFTENTPYLAVFIPGGHGVLNGVPESATVGKILHWAHDNGRFFISLCHGPASMLAANLPRLSTSSSSDKYIWEGYSIYVFPDALDKGANIDMGYIPGQMSWLVGERLEQLGIKILNRGTIAGDCHKDRLVLTGDSPLASNNLGKLAAKTLLEAVEKE